MAREAVGGRGAVLIIRVVLIGSLVAVLVLVLYEPAAQAPERFIEQLHIEHELTASVWGEEHAMRILARMLDLHADAREAAAAPTGMAEVGTANALDTAVANQMSEAGARLFGSRYFKSVDALFALATYRVCGWLEWLPVVLVFVAAAIFDGLVRRVVKSKEFRHHDPELFALHACLVIMIAGATAIAFVLPVTVHPMLLGVAPLGMGVFASGAVANFHRRA